MNRQPLDDPLRRVYFVDEVARMLGASEDRVRRWAKPGSGHWLAEARIAGCQNPLRFWRVAVDRGLSSGAAEPAEYGRPQLVRG